MWLEISLWFMNFTILNLIKKNFPQFFKLKKFLLLWIEYYSERGHKVYHVNEMLFTTISNKWYMVFELFIEKPLQMVDLKMNKISDDNPHLQNALDRSFNRP